MRRACLSCGALTPGTRCPGCTRAKDRARGTTTDRGYGAQHQQARASLERTLPAPCFYCGGVIEPGSPFVAAHVVDGDPSAGWVVSHPVCNQRAMRR